ncbi:MAG: YceH family protein [Bryobacteraceae bacterium]
MDIALNPAEVRVLGSLIEKESTTPEYYPLTLNSLVAACNQKSNRWPASDYDDRDILDALGGLRSHGYAAEIIGGGRVPKYAQRFTEKLNMGRRETAILCVLMLRGQQTLGEIRTRTERIYNFSDLDEVELVVQKLMDRPEGALVQKLPPAAGMKEPRYAQTLGGVVEHAEVHAPPAAASSSDRLSALEGEVSRLREEVAELRRRLDAVL